MSKNLPSIFSKLKLILNILSKSIQSHRRDSSLGLICYLFLLISAILKRLVILIKLKRWKKIQLLCQLVQLNLYHAIGFKRSSDFNININKNNRTIIEDKTLSTKKSEMVNFIDQLSSIFRLNYSYISEYRTFNSVFTTFDHIPNALPLLYPLPKLLLKILSKDPIKIDIMELFNSIQKINDFFMQNFTDLAWLIDRGLLKSKYFDSESFWKKSSKFWFASILVDLLIKYYSTKQWTWVLNRSSLLLLLVAYHWGWDWNFLNDLNLSLVNIAIYLPKVIENYKLASKELNFVK